MSSRTDPGSRALSATAASASSALSLLAKTTNPHPEHTKHTYTFSMSKCENAEGKATRRMHGREGGF